MKKTKGTKNPTAIRYVLKWPVSVNRLWRYFRGRVVLSKRGRAYKASVVQDVSSAGLGGFDAMARLSVRLVAYQPDNRRRDLDNLRKILYDAFTEADVWEDDSQVDREETIRDWFNPTGGVLVEIKQIARGIPKVPKPPKQKKVVVQRELPLGQPW